LLLCHDGNKCQKDVEQPYTYSYYLLIIFSATLALLKSEHAAHISQIQSAHEEQLSDLELKLEIKRQLPAPFVHTKVTHTTSAPPSLAPPSSAPTSLAPPSLAPEDAATIDVKDSKRPRCRCPKGMCVRWEFLVVLEEVTEAYPAPPPFFCL
jgi:hypothetical protein